MRPDPNFSRQAAAVVNSPYFEMSDLEGIKQLMKLREGLSKVQTFDDLPDDLRELVVKAQKTIKRDEPTTDDSDPNAVQQEIHDLQQQIAELRAKKGAPNV